MASLVGTSTVKAGRFYDFVLPILYSSRYLKESVVLKGFLTCICRCLTSINMVQVLFCGKTLFWRSPPTHFKLRMGRSGHSLVRFYTSVEITFLFPSFLHVVMCVVTHTFYCITTALPWSSRKSFTRAYRGTLAGLGRRCTRFAQ